MGRSLPDRSNVRGCSSFNRISIRRPGLGARARALHLAARGLRGLRGLVASASALRVRLLAAVRGAIATRIPAGAHPTPSRARSTLAILLEADGLLLGDVCATDGGLALRASLPNRSSSAACVAARWRGEEVVAKVFGETSGEAAAHAAEARLLLAAGPHPNIVRLLGATAHPPRLLLLARAGGGSLHDRLHNGQPTTGVRRWAEAFAWGRDVASALSHLHSLRPPLVHRDVKAANVLLDLPAEADGGGARAGTRAAGCTAVAEPTRTGSLGRARLCDFGSGAALPANPSDSLGVGTPGWMAPELLGADGAVHAGCACDVFSLGCLLFELASRTLPFAALGEAEMMAAAAAGRTPLDEAPLLADTPARLVTLIRECLAFDAYARPHAAVVAERLERMRAEQLVSSAGIAAAGSREREEA